jgi:hypothetical protein
VKSMVPIVQLSIINQRSTNRFFNQIIKSYILTFFF